MSGFNKPFSSTFYTFIPLKNKQNTFFQKTISKRGFIRGTKQVTRLEIFVAYTERIPLKKNTKENSCVFFMHEHFDVTCFLRSGRSSSFSIDQS